MKRKLSVFFAVAALCLIAASLYAQDGLKRTMLQQTNYPGDKYITVSALVEVAPGVEAARHTHSGIETGYVIEGENIVFSVDGQPDKVLKAGDSYLVEPGVAHSIRNTSKDRTAKAVSTFMVEKDKPLATPAPK